MQAEVPSTPKAMTILAIEDDPGDAELLRRRLAQIPGFQFQFRHARDTRGAKAELSHTDVDIAFLDYHLGASNGLDLLEQLRSSGETRPVVVLTGNADVYTAASMTRAGADDYLAKSDLHPEALLRAIKNANERQLVREHSKRSEVIVERLADENVELSLANRLDALTGLLSRAAWTEIITQEHERSSRYSRTYSVLLIDVDYFKSLNDIRGHAAGDECLNRLAKCFLEVCRSMDAVGRHGGEEFVVLLPETDSDGALAMGERIRKAVWDLGIARSDSPDASPVTVSIGVASSPADQWEDVVTRADESLYVAKALGRNLVWGERATKATARAQGPHERITVVVVDDDAGDAELLRRQLEELRNLSFDYIHCDNAKTALTALKSRQEALVFLDYRLGETSGVDTLGELRAAGVLGPVIAVTGNADEYIVADLMRAGADDYIAKGDVGPDVLRRAIRNAASQYSRRSTEARNRQLVAELQSAKRSLEGKNRRLTELYKTAHQFVDNVSHEFRTPLTVIKEFSSILRDGLAGSVSTEQGEYLDIVLNRVDDLSTMVDDMLDISKLEAGVLGVARRNCQMQDVIQNVRTTLERKAAAAKVNLTIGEAPTLPDVYCDPEKIARVLINLTVNAIKFCEEGGNVSIEAARPDDGPFVRVRVTDNGRGIAPENVEAIFERFKQLEGNLRSSTKGFGLGLSIAKELVHLNFGDITVESRLGEGSTFAFTVPVADPATVLPICLRRLSTPAASLLSAQAGAAVDARVLDALDGFLQHQLRRSDLLFRTAPDSWLIVAAAGESELGCMIARIERARADTNRNRPSGPLPLLRIEIKGTWRGFQQSRELIKRFECERRGDAGAGI
ncbi:Non-motile and phage-resistance protein [Phycisphaerae bacterium RAS1]|nr:Non-motile and phage-resistance protein [Phycisphaerae bacterium RAS1]